ncbi:hypothetical protein LX36DRAFT_94451 [Colletotrichum falcatum]|nr:hypothetical protein LX36DRAFT_94451 [Colletotrichum falcatum]
MRLIFFIFYFLLETGNFFGLGGGEDIEAIARRLGIEDDHTEQGQKDTPRHTTNTREQAGRLPWLLNFARLYSVRCEPPASYNL